MDAHQSPQDTNNPKGLVDDSAHNLAKNLFATSSKSFEDIPKNLPPPSANVKAEDTFKKQGDSEPNTDLVKPDHNITDNDAFPSTATLVAKLLQPDKNAFDPMVKGVKQPDMLKIRLNWVKAQLTEAHFVYSPYLHRSVLRDDSKIRKFGLAAGLPRGFWEWLCGDWEQATGGEKKREEYWVKRDDFKSTIAG